MDDQQNPQAEEMNSTPNGDVANQEVTNTDQSQLIILQNLEGLIKSHIANISTLQEELGKQREMFESAFEGDVTYRNHVEEAKKANKVKAETRSQIMKQPAMVQLNNKIKDLRFQMKEMQNELSEYLLEYQRLAQTNTIETDDGEILEIVNNAKLAKRTSK